MMDLPCPLQLEKCNFDFDLCLFSRQFGEHFYGSFSSTLSLPCGLLRNVCAQTARVTREEIQLILVPRMSASPVQGGIGR